MKTRFFLIFSLILIVFVIWFFRPKRQALQNPSIVKTNEIKSQSLIAKTNPVPPNYTPPKITHPLEGTNYYIWLQKVQKEAGEKEDNEWRTPIEFYGRVIDESNSAVAGASVHFSWTDLSAKGNSEQDTISDNNGGFSLGNTTGKNLIVTVSKAGYYEYAPAGLAFNYAGENQNFVPDTSNPVVFRLRKKGEGADLIHYDKSFQLPKDGTPILIDLPTGKKTASSQNAIQVEAWIYDSEKVDRWKYNWKCRVSVPGGGLQIYDEEFPFLAPEDDYTNEEVIDMPVTNNASWSDIARRNYYVHTADGKFGRMVFKMIPGGDHFCELNLCFNPSGSRNLE